ncbi:MAG: hypothetical protein M0018_11685 [Nitrospiraceae bacterium]|nr:hypothetical protein [Nitrospiraceae bacterium]
MPTVSGGKSAPKQLLPSTARTYWLLFALAALSFLITLPVNYVGEEAIWTVTSYEMWFHGEYTAPVTFGSHAIYWRPPFYNLAIIPVAQLTGWSHVLAAARLVTMASTLLSALLLAWFVKKLTGDKAFAAFSALVYLTLGDVFFYGGWLCYPSQFFTVFALGAMVFGWLALDNESYAYLAAALIAADAAFFGKALTAYVFYGLTMLVITYRKRRWNFLFSQRSVLLHEIALVVPVLWYLLAPAGGVQSSGMIEDITDKLKSQGGWNYLIHFVHYPLQTLEQLMPFAAVVIFAMLRRSRLGQWRKSPDMVTSLLVLFVNYLPYWLPPQSGMRYIMPLFPFAAMVMAFMVFYGDKQVRKWGTGVIVFAIAVKFALGIWGFPFFEKRFRGSHTVAQEIVRTTGGRQLYIKDVASSGFTLAAHIDRLLYPGAPITLPPKNFTSGYVISYLPDKTIGSVYKKYRVGNDDVFLLCRGTACNR